MMDSSHIETDAIFEVFLQPDEFYWGDSETRIKTILGSCIAICLWHPGLRIGGMSHSLLPSRSRGPDDKLQARYVEEAVEILAGEAKRAGTPPKSYRVKIFGGANIVQGTSLAIGDRNYKIASAALAAAGFIVYSQHVGGTESRNVVFDISTGDTWLRRIERT